MTTQFDPRAEYAKLKAKVDAGGGMTARQWDWFDARMKEWEPDEYERRRKAASVRIAIEYFEKHLAPAGYKLVPPDADGVAAFITDKMAADAAMVLNKALVHGNLFGVSREMLITALQSEPAPPTV